MEYFTTESQNRAFEEAQKIERFSNGEFEIFKVIHPEKFGSSLAIIFTIDCSPFKSKKKSALPLKSRERFLLVIDTDYPLKNPSIYSFNQIWAGFPHIQVRAGMKGLLFVCLYQAPSVEWNPNGGIFSLIERLLTFLKMAGKGEFDSLGGAIHPPIAYPTSRFKTKVIFSKNTPKFNGSNWLGFGEIHEVSVECLEITEFISIENIRKYGKKYCLALMSNNTLPVEFPEKFHHLFEILTQGSSLSLDALVNHLRLLTCIQEKNSPIYILIGVPMRGIAGEQTLYHLEVFRSEEWLEPAVENSLNIISKDKRLNELGVELDKKIKEYLKDSSIFWLNKFENRPEIVKSRSKYLVPKIKILILGCGAIGSQFAENLVRYGAQQIVLWDNGTVHPGLICRQNYSYADIGKNKAVSLKNYLSSINLQANIESYETKFKHDDFCKEVVFSCDLILDFSACNLVFYALDLFYQAHKPRFPSLFNLVVGHKATRSMSFFMPKNFEGGPYHIQRCQKLSAHKSRALTDFAEDFWPRKQRTNIFQPEPGCSEPTFEGGLLEVVSASNMSFRFLIENCLDNSEISESKLFYFEEGSLDSKSGIRKVLSIPPPAPNQDKNSGYNVYIDKDSLRDLNQEIDLGEKKRGKSIENGGLIFGEINHALKSIWINNISGPPKDSKFSHDKFVCGTNEANSLNDRYRRETGNTNQFIGSWHTHPRSKGVPSGEDLNAVKQLLYTDTQPRNELLLMIIGHSISKRKINCYLFSQRDFKSLNVGDIL